MATFDNFEDISSIIDVKCCGGSDAEVDFLLRDDDGTWRTESSSGAFIGRGGLGKTREGDGATPEGEFRARRAFGIKKDPGTALEYTDVTETTVACDEEGPWYNRIIDTAVTGPVGGERMREIEPQYNYGIELDFNNGNIYPLGSAIFFHCKGPKPWTGGCVAADEDFVRHVLEKCGPAPLFRIHKK